MINMDKTYSITNYFNETLSFDMAGNKSIFSGKLTNAQAASDYIMGCLHSSASVCNLEQYFIVTPTE
jgi:hypothetical protein